MRAVPRWGKLRTVTDATPKEITVRWLGRVGYEEALHSQEKLLDAKIADPHRADELWLLEHEPVYTIGRTPDHSSLREVAALPHPLVRINRGGQATYHGPGQLVGYPIIDLRQRGRDLHRYLRALEAALIALLAELAVQAHGVDGLTGVWVGKRKIASLGVGVRRWVAMHGFALNVGADLKGFEAITPCGIAGVEMTSLTRETGRRWEVQQVGELAIPHLLTALQNLIPNA